MSLVATLLTHPARPGLTPEMATSAKRRIGASRIDWLSPGTAVDLPVESGDRAAMEADLRALFSGLPVDVVVQRTAGRRKALLIADMDSTMIDQECIDELADMAGFREQVSAITARAMNGEIAFEPALRERVALLKGLPATIIAQVIAERITLASGGGALVATMKRHGAHTALVSGGFTAFTGPVAEMLGFDETQANLLEATDGRFLGTVAEPILGREAKADALLSISKRLGITPKEAIAVGDGANDLAMLALAGAGVALHAKPSVAAQARIRIDHGDLTALLYLQGYRDGEIVP